MRKKKHPSRPAAEQVEQMVSASTAQVTQMAGSQSVLGTPACQNGVTVIPVSKISIGFAGGGAEDTAAGVGAKMEVTPVSMLVVKGTRVRAVAMPLENRPTAADSFGIVLQRITGWIDEARQKKIDK